MVLTEDGGAESLCEDVVAAADIDRGDLTVVADVDELAVDRIYGALKREAAGWNTSRPHPSTTTTPGGSVRTAVVEFDEKPVDGAR